MAKWIKIETHTPDKAEIRHIARLCHCTKAEAFLAFFRVFVWLDEQTEDGHVEFFTHEDADEIGGLTGLGQALETVRWIIFGPAGAVVSNWDRHNGQSAKRRCLDAERSKRFRERHAATVTNVTPERDAQRDQIREDKRRED
jgi:DNA replication protein DnaT